MRAELTRKNGGENIEWIEKRRVGPECVLGYERQSRLPMCAGLGLSEYPNQKEKNGVVGCIERRK